MTALQRIESAVGTLLRYDGKYCLWASTGTWDIRDVLRRIPKLSLDEAVDALAEASEAEHKRIKAERIAAKEKENTL
jgi:hypothetical protein